MDDKQMREAFEAKWPMPRYCVWTGSGYAATHHTAWDAHAYCRKWEGWREGYAAGMERAAQICDGMYSNMTPQECACAIRAAQPGDRNA